MRGNTGSAPLKVLDEEGLASGGQRWRFVPLRNRLQNASARPAALPSIDFASNLANVAPDDTTFSHFATTLATESDSNITVTFATYVACVRPLSLSLPLVYRNRKKILDSTFRCLRESTANGAEATNAIANCLSALAKDLGPNSFHPFFAQVIRSIAQVFERDSEQTESDGGKQRGESLQTVFWDPDTSIVPLFASLAEITKILLQYLAKDPAKTISDALPLLSNSHYRVREMTAESFLGYLIRKTRDSDLLQQLTYGLLEAANHPNIVAHKQRFAIDGLGVSMFEAIRLPSGRLHSRATDVLSTALRGICPQSSKAQQDGRFVSEHLAVVSRCFSALSRHLENREDVQTIAAVLVSEGEEGLQEKSETTIGNVGFLIRKWIESGRRILTSHLGSIFLQRILNFLTSCLETFGSKSRVVFECFGAVLSLLLHSPEPFRQKSGRRGMSTALEIAAAEGSISSIRAAVSVLLKHESSIWDTAQPQDVLGGIGALCNRMTELLCAMSEPSFVPEEPLRLAVKFLSSSKHKFGASALRNHACRIPLLDFQIKTAFPKLFSISEPRIATHARDTNVMPYLLEYLCCTRVEGVEPFFKALCVTDSLSFQMRCKLIIAFSVQVSGLDKSSYREVHAKIRPLLKESLSALEASEPSSLCFKALQLYFQAFPKDIDILTSAQQGVDVSNLTDRLIKCLSSNNSDVRVSSAALLASLHDHAGPGVKLDMGAPNPRKNDAMHTELHSNDDQSYLDLRICLSDKEVSLAPLFRTIHDVLQVPDSLNGIDRSQRIIQELVRLMETVHELKGTAVCAVVHASIGLLRTRLHAVWKHASQLWMATLSQNEPFAMSIIIQALEGSGQEVASKESDTVDFGNGGEEEEEVEKEEEAVAFEDNEMDLDAGQQDIAQHTSETHVLRSSTRSGNKRKRSFVGSDVYSKQQRARNRKEQLVNWNSTEWSSSKNQQVSSHAIGDCLMKATQNEERGSSTDVHTFTIELLRTLLNVPRCTVRYRQRLIRLYLAIDPSFSQKRVRNGVATSFADLLAKMGGLKCCESDGEIEKAMRNRLLSDLTRSDTSLQASSLRCLCASRSHVKPYRDSFARVIKGDTFREELAIITDTLFSSREIASDLSNLSAEEEEVIDVLTRICVSKLRGKRKRHDQHRAAVLSFVVSKLPREVALPRITDLLLNPISKAIDQCELQMQRKESVDAVISIDHVIQKGILTSIELISRHCRRAMPISCWRKVTVGTLVLLLNAGTGSGGQSLRSTALQLFSEMYRMRPESMVFLTQEILHAVRVSRFDASPAAAGGGTPALLTFLAAVFETNNSTDQLKVLIEHEWALNFCLGMMQQPSLDVKRTALSLKVAAGVSRCLADQMKPGPTDIVFLNETQQRLAKFCAECLQSLLKRLVDMFSEGRLQQKKWSTCFGQANEVIAVLAANPSEPLDVFLALTEGLCSFLVSDEKCAVSPLHALRVLASIGTRICTDQLTNGTKNHESGFVRQCILRLLPLLSHHKFIADDLSHNALCATLSACKVPDLKVACSLLREVNAISSSRMDEPDLDRRIEGLNEIIDFVKQGLGDRPDEPIAAGDLFISSHNGSVKEILKCKADALTALFHGCVASIRTNDSAVRGTSGYCLLLLSRWASRCQTETASKCKYRFFRILFSSVASARKLLHRREYCQALGELVRNADVSSLEGTWEGFKCFPLLKSLANAKDLDVDFFENLVHLQAHRRSRALRQLEKRISVSMSSGAIANEEGMITSCAQLFSLPLGMQIAMEPMDEEDLKKLRRARKSGEARENAQRDVAVWASSLVGRAAGMLPWTDYRSCISGLLKRVKTESNEDRIEILYKLLVKVAAAFPDIAEPSVQSFLVERLIPEMLLHVRQGGIDGQLLGIRETEHFSRRRTDRSGITFRAPIAIAASQLMSRLQQEHLGSLVPLLITPLAAALRSRMASTREAAKKALNSVVFTLGEKYFSYVLRQVLSSLNEGYRKETCVYVVHYLLEGIRKLSNGDADVEGWTNFSVDDCTSMVTSFLRDEIESGLQETKQDFEDPNASAHRIRQASIRANKAAECAEILAERATFESKAECLWQPFLICIAAATSSKLISRVEEVLNRLLLGFSKNSSMTLEVALKHCYRILTPNADTIHDLSTPSTNPMNSMREEIVLKEINHRVIKFAFKLLNTVMARNWAILNGTSKHSRELQARCEPFMPLIVEALEGGSDDLTLVSFKVSQRFLKLPLPGNVKVAQKISDTIVNVLSHGVAPMAQLGTQSEADELFNTCLRSAAVLITSVGTKGFRVVSRERIEALLNISRNCIDNGSMESRSAALALLRAVVSSKIIIPAVYDIMERVNSLAIHAQSSSLRSSCASMSITFLVTFPLGSKRVRQTVEFFVRNLNYKMADGRMAALGGLRTIIQKFPIELLDQESEYLLVSLASCVARDVDAACRARASEALEELFSCVSSGRKITDLLRMACTWIGVKTETTAEEGYTLNGAPDGAVQRSGIACLKSACKSNRLSHLQLTSIVRVTCTAIRNCLVEGAWETRYALLDCCEAAIEAQSNLQGTEPRIEIQKNMKIFWEALESSLLHDHAWVRLSSSRLLGHHLSAAGGRKPTLHMSDGWTVWSSNGLVRELLKALCLQLESNHLSMELAEQATKNLLCMADVVRLYPAVGNVEGHGPSIDLPEEESETGELGNSRTLKWLVGRVSGMAIRIGRDESGSLRQACSLRFLLVTSKWWGREVVQRYKQFYVAPAMKVLESGQVNDISKLRSDSRDLNGVSRRTQENFLGGGTSGGTEVETVKALAQALQTALIEALDASEYYAQYHAQKMRKDAVKLERKRQDALVAIIDPERFAKKRRLKAEARRRKKKRSSGTRTDGASINVCEAPSKKHLTEDL